MGNSKRHIAFILGAGFSVPAGYPTANKLNEDIKLIINNKKYQSFQDRHNGILESYIFDKVLIDYNQINNFNYEEYFDVLNNEIGNKLDQNRLRSYIESGMYKYFWKGKKEFESQICNNQISSIFNAVIKECNNYKALVEGRCEEYQNIIAHALLNGNIDGKCHSFNKCYLNFVKILTEYRRNGYQIDIFTLNHDLFLESILSLKELKDDVCTGFGSDVKIIRNKKYVVFNVNFYNKPIKVYKLHGSIDIHELSFYNRQEKKFIKILDGYSDSNAFLMDTDKGVNIIPMFLTGRKTKKLQYYNEPYKSLFKEFKKHLDMADKLVVIGYGGNDNVINNVVKDYYNWKEKQLIVVAPKVFDHKFVKEYKGVSKDISVTDLTYNDLI